MAACFLCCCQTIQGQSKPGTFTLIPKVGMNISNLTGSAPEWVCLTSPDPITLNPDGTVNIDELQEWERIVGFSSHYARFGFNAGVEIDYQLSKKWALAADVTYSVQGANYDDWYNPDGTKRTKNIIADMRCVNVPLTLKYYVYRSLAVRAGVQIGYLRNEIKGDFYRKGVKAKNRNARTVYFDKIYIAVPVGLSYEFGNILVDARYDIGATNIYNSKFHKKYHDSPSTRTRVVSLSIGYKLSLGKY